MRRRKGILGFRNSENLCRVLARVMDLLKDKPRELGFEAAAESVKSALCHGGIGERRQ